MKVILLQNIEKFGEKWDVKEVKPGYARNYLMPKKLVQIATPTAITYAQAQKQAVEKRKKEEQEQHMKLIKKAAGRKIRIVAKATDKGALFAAITAKKISAALAKQNIDISEDAIHIREPIKTVGEHEIILQEQDTKSKITVVVEAEN